MAKSVTKWVNVDEIKAISRDTVTASLALGSFWVLTLLVGLLVHEPVLTGTLSVIKGMVLVGIILRLGARLVTTFWSRGDNAVFA